MAFTFKLGGVWYVRYKDEAGRWQKKSCGKDAKKSEAEYLANEYTAKEMNRRHKAPVRMVEVTLADALTSFRDTIIPRSAKGIDKQASSICREKASVNNIISFVKANSLLSFKTFDKEMAQKFMDHRAREGMSPKTRREERRLLRKFFKWAIKQHYCSENATEEIIAPKLPKKKMRYFSEEELIKIFELASEPYLSIFKFLYLTGLRTGELCNLEWRDYDAAEKLLTIRIVSADKKNRTPGNKTKREDTIPLSNDAIAILEQRKHHAKESDTHIFLNHAGNRLDDDNIYRNLQPILTKAKIMGAHPHTFRHTFASHLVIKGVSIYTVKELLRHASVKETEIYAHLSKATTRNAVEMLSLSSKSGKPEKCTQKAPGLRIERRTTIGTLPESELSIPSRMAAFG